MRQGQQNKRMRGRNRKGPNPLTRSYESNGGDVKIRGTALHIAEKYVQLARDAQSSGDRVAAENYFQHAEHYYRIVAAAQAQMPQPQPIIRSDELDEDDEGGEFRINGNAIGGERAPGAPQGAPSFGLSDPQPYVNGSSDGGDEGPDDGDVGYTDGFPQPRDMNGGANGSDRGSRFQGHSQGGHRQDGQQGGGGQGQGGHFRRRRFRDRYNDRDRDRDRGQNAAPSNNERGDRDRQNGEPVADTASESSEE